MQGAIATIAALMLCHGVQNGMVSKMYETNHAAKSSLEEIEENKQFARPMASSLSDAEHRPVYPRFPTPPTTPR